MGDNIAEIDKNFKLETKLELDDPVFYDVKKPPFCIYGLMSAEDGSFCRMPEKTAETVSEKVKILNYNTSGGRVRFKTDSPYVAIKAVMPTMRQMPHMAFCGSAGFDMYEVKENGTHTWVKSFFPPIESEGGYESADKLPYGYMRDLIINFPLYSCVSELYVVLKKGSRLEEGGKYRYEKPVLYYGSSITQGASASKPGLCYPAIISRRFDCNYIDLGFAGACRGEKEMAEYLAGIDCSVFVCDYDHNTPTPEYLRETHLPIYLEFRKTHPETPIVFVSAPISFVLNKSLFDAKMKRREVVMDTYTYACEHGDKNVAFVDGYAMFNTSDRDVYAIDGTHPTDAGFLRMADFIGAEISRFIK